MTVRMWWQCPACSNINEDDWDAQRVLCGMCGAWYDEKEKYHLSEEEILTWCVNEMNEGDDEHDPYWEFG